MSDVAFQYPPTLLGNDIMVVGLYGFIMRLVIYVTLQEIELYVKRPFNFTQLYFMHLYTMLDTLFLILLTLANIYIICLAATYQIFCSY